MPKLQVAGDCCGDLTPDLFGHHEVFRIPKGAHEADPTEADPTEADPPLLYGPRQSEPSTACDAPKETSTPGSEDRPAKQAVGRPEAVKAAVRKQVIEEGEERPRTGVQGQKAHPAKNQGCSKVKALRVHTPAMQGQNSP